MQCIPGSLFLPQEIKHFTMHNDLDGIVIKSNNSIIFTKLNESLKVRENNNYTLVSSYFIIISYLPIIYF